MIFYASPLSSYSAKVRIALCTKGVPFEELLPPNGYRSPDYRAIVPMGTLPAIQIGDWVLSESEAINEYLEEAYPEPAMLARDLRLRAQVRFVCRFHDLRLEPRVRALADCGPLVTIPFASWVLAACGQPLALPRGLQTWLDAASAHPAVERALAPWRAATHAWLAS